MSGSSDTHCKKIIIFLQYIYNKIIRFNKIAILLSKNCKKSKNLVKYLNIIAIKL